MSDLEEVGVEKGSDVEHTNEAIERLETITERFELDLTSDTMKLIELIQDPKARFREAL